jgi:hypothetical protein
MSDVENRALQGDAQRLYGRALSAVLFRQAVQSSHQFLCATVTATSPIICMRT